MPETVLIVGASDKPHRYAFRAMQELKRSGHQVVLLNPRLNSIQGQACFHTPGEIECAIDTVTVYLRPDRLAAIAEELCELAPRRVILNPGTESDSIRQIFEDRGIRVQEDCTLVLLSLSRFSL